LVFIPDGPGDCSDYQYEEDGFGGIINRVCHGPGLRGSTEIEKARSNSRI
jgi:hypothetical protein